MFIISLIFSARCYARGLCCHAVSVRLSVRLSRSWILSKWIKYLQIFSPSGRHTILVFFPYQTSWQYSYEDPITRASNAGARRQSVYDKKPVSVTLKAIRAAIVVYPELKWYHFPRIRPPRPSLAYQAPQKLGIAIFRPLLHHSWIFPGDWYRQKKRAAGTANHPRRPRLSF